MLETPIKPTKPRKSVKTKTKSRAKKTDLAKRTENAARMADMRNQYQQTQNQAINEALKKNEETFAFRFFVINQAMQALDAGESVEQIAQIHKIPKELILKWIEDLNSFVGSDKAENLKHTKRVFDQGYHAAQKDILSKIGDSVLTLLQDAARKAVQNSNDVKNS